MADEWTTEEMEKERASHACFPFFLDECENGDKWWGLPRAILS